VGLESESSQADNRHKLSKENKESKKRPNTPSALKLLNFKKQDER